MTSTSIPKLRFPEFLWEWEKKKLGEVFYNSREKGNSLIPIYSVTQKHGLVPRQSIDRNIHNDAAPGDNLVVNVDCLTYNMMRMWQGSVGIAKVKCMVSPAYVVLEPSPATNSTFFLYLFERNRSLFLFKSYSHGLTLDRLRLYYDDFASIHFEIPALPEQQKIASFLTSVDEKLQALKKKKSLLEQYKKGVMQKIFSQELRFKDDDGSEFAEWEVKKLGEIGSFQTSSIDKLTKENEKEVYLINYMNVYRHESINNETIKTFQIVTAKDIQIESCNLKKGDILFTPSSETPDDIGHSVVIFEDLDRAVFSYHLMRFRPSIEINILYSHYFCNIPSVLAQLTKLATGSTRFTISVKSFSSIEIQLPSLPEQTKIANFLSALDDKINHVQVQVEKMELWKKGLLQQMFV